MDGGDALIGLVCFSPPADWKRNERQYNGGGAGCINMDTLKSVYLH